MVVASSSRSDITDLQVGPDANEGKSNTKEGETIGLRADDRIVVTCMLPDELGVAGMIGEENTVSEPASNRQGSKENNLSFESLQKFDAVRMNRFWRDAQSSLTSFALSSIKLTCRSYASDKVSLSFVRKGFINLSQDEKTAVDMLMQMPFGGGKLSEARKDGNQEFLSIVLWDWQTETHRMPDEHFRLRDARLSLYS